MMKDKKNRTTLILGGLCVVAIIAAIVLIAAGGKDTTTTPPDTNTPNSEVVTPNETPENTEPVIPDAREDGEKRVEVVKNGESLGAIETLVIDKVYYTNLEELIEFNLVDFKFENGKITYSTGADDITIEKDKITIIAHVDHSHDASGAVIDKPQDVEQVFEVKDAILTRNDKTYLHETALYHLGISDINDKSLVYISDKAEIEKISTSIKIEDVIFNTELAEMTEEEVKALAELVDSTNFDVTVKSAHAVKKNFSESNVVSLFKNALNAGLANTIYTGKTDGKYVVMLNNNAAGILLGEIMPSIHGSDEYANVRILIETNEEGKITNIYADTYYRFDSNDIYYYVTLAAK